MNYFSPFHSKIRFQYQNFEIQQKILKGLLYNTKLSSVIRRKLS